MRRLLLLATILVGISAPTVAQEGSFAALLAGAERGDVASQIALAHSLRGTGRELGGYEEAAKWYQAAAEAGETEAQLELGKLILYGAVPQPPDVGIAWLEQAAGDRAEAAFELGMAYEFGRGIDADARRAGELYRAAAEADIGGAAARLGQLLETGALGTVDLNAAVVHYEHAAGLSDAAGTFALGRAYELGLGPLEADPGLAIKHYQTASQLGSGDASYRMGQIFEAGDLVEVDYGAAFSAYGLAAVQGHVDAHVAKGRMFEEGLGTARSRASAYREYKAAHELGSEEGTRRYEELRNELLRDSEKNFVEVPVLFATDRAPRAQGESPRFFANEPDPDGLTHLGSLRVRVAVDLNEAASRDPRRFRSNGNTSAEDIRAPALLDGAALAQAVKDQLADFDDRILVFVHGYWNSFEEAVAAAAQLAWDLELPALPIVYSWPSLDRGPVKRPGWTSGVLDCPGCYFADQLEAELSGPRFATFMESLRAAATSAEIDILAHSMGNRVLLYGFDALQPSIAIRELVMAAPDLPVRLLTHRISGIKARSGRISLYAAKWDWALGTIGRVETLDRAGSTHDGIPLFVSGDAQTLDATAVAGYVRGHSYVYSSAAVINDLRTIIAQHAQPAEPPRVWLEDRSRPPAYWAFTPGS